MKKLIYILSATVALTLGSCQGNPASEGGDKVAPTMAASAGDERRPDDREVYNMGREHARDMLYQCNSLAEIEEQLLEVRARIYNIECRVGRSASLDYQSGFTDYIRENCDTLARLMDI